MKKWIAISVGAVLFLLLFPFIFSVLSPWTNIQCEKQYVDINTGIVRIEKYYWFIKYSDVTKPSFLSTSIGAESLEPPEWHTVNTLSFAHRNSPHYRFHGAISQIRNLELIARFYEIREKDLSVIGMRMIELWKTDQSYHSVDDYLHNVGEEYEKELKNKAT